MTPSVPRLLNSAITSCLQHNLGVHLVLLHAGTGSKITLTPTTKFEVFRNDYLSRN